MMRKVTRTQAETRFSVIEKRQQSILNERNEAAADVRKNTAKLKALRLRREAENLQA
jgi:hypothetical protein